MLFQEGHKVETTYASNGMTLAAFRSVCFCARSKMIFLITAKHNLTERYVTLFESILSLRLYGPIKL